MQSTLTIFTTLSPFAHPLPIGRKDHKKGPVLHPQHLHLFFNCILIFQGEFTLVLHMCLYCALVRLTTFFSYSCSIALLPYYSAAFSVFCYSIFIHKCNVFQCYSLVSFLFPLSPLHSPLRQTHYYNNFSPLCLSLCVFCLCLSLYMCIQYLMV
jgi:hypothetical protein